jgi:endogenous inhibitor of DNA gyrase (YacG/DUF329 family)
MRTALAIRYEDIDENTVEQLTVECPNCDPDSPTSVHPKLCPVCQGTRRAPVALGTVAKELKKSRVEASSDSSGEDEFFG